MDVPFHQDTVKRFSQTSGPSHRCLASSPLAGTCGLASGRAGELYGASVPAARSSAVPAAHPTPGLCGRPPVTYRLKTREGFRRGVAALSPDTAAERPAAVGERLQPRVGSRPGSPRQRAGGGARARAGGGAPGPGPLNRRRARPPGRAWGGGAVRGARGASDRTIERASGRAGGDLKQVRTDGRADAVALDRARPPGQLARDPRPQHHWRGTFRQAVRAAWSRRVRARPPLGWHHFYLVRLLWIPAVDKDGSGEMVSILQEYIFSLYHFSVAVTVKINK
ncbi:translation initiation factor IF-2-like [Mesocricetus auratus]|uniref:Translation initiation factor IF-2-like n=1 Tax=Mesocricetus auratus TaxID=10036 RepID=A0ABM2X4V9_MESAU|nr:translation initiation factor IF-2-like [Mesocricetus auratus]